MGAVDKTWCVLSAGELVEGSKTWVVVSRFAKAFNLSNEKALPYFKKGKLINKDLSESEAQKYQKRLETVGLKTIIQNQANEKSASVSHNCLPPVSKTKNSRE